MRHHHTRNLCLLSLLASGLVAFIQGGGWDLEHKGSQRRRVLSLERQYPSTSMLVLRGGSGSHPVPSQNADPSISSVSTAAVELATSLWIFSRHLASHHVVPVFQDPHGRVVVPMRRIFQAAQNSNTAPKVNTAVDSSTKAEAFSSTLETKGKVSQCTTTPSLGVLFLPYRLLKLSITAWVLAETLDHFGILNEGTPYVLRSQFNRVWYDVQPKVHAWHEQLGQWWSTATQKGLPGMPPKYQFAVGASLGMIASPLLATVTFSLWQPAVLLYGLSELNALFKAKGKWHLGAILGGGDGGENLIASLESLLDRVRQWVRGCFPEPEAPTSGALLDTSGGGKPSYRGSSSTAEPQIRQFRQKLKDFGDRVVDSSKHSLEEFRERIEAPENNSRNMVVEMIRHGFVVGGAIGLLVGV